MEISKKELDAVTSLPADERYSHFIKRATDLEALWGLYDDGWAVSANDAGQQVMPVWPAREYAELCQADDWKNYEARSIALDEFLTEMIPDLQEKNFLLGVMLLPEGDAIAVNPDKVRDDLEAELAKY